MGRNSKQRRDAKRARKIGRRSGHAGGGMGPDDVVRMFGDMARDGVRSLFVALVGRERDTPEHWAAEVWKGIDPALSVRWERSIADAVVAEWVFWLRSTYERGWWPHELPRLAERKVPKLGSRLALDLIAYERRLGGDGDRAWSFDLLDLPADPGSPWEIACRSANALGSPEPDAAWLLAAMKAVIDLAGCPEGAVPAPTATSGVDDAVLSKVRALLAQAESTPFEGEAEAFAAKAQQLISRHAIDEALLAGSRAATDVPIQRRIPIDDPYFDAKAHLLHVVADANRCHAVTLLGLLNVAVVGYESDLDAIELLFTSLLVQAVAGTTRATAETTGGRTRSYRQSYLIGFGDRIGQRLRSTDQQAIDEVAASEAGAGLLPVLAERRDNVSDAVESMYPDLTRTRLSDSNRHGRYAGMAAADLVDLSVGTPVEEPTPPSGSIAG